MDHFAYHWAIFPTLLLPNPTKTNVGKIDVACTVSLCFGLTLKTKNSGACVSCGDWFNFANSTIAGSQTGEFVFQLLIKFLLVKLFNYTNQFLKILLD